MDKLEKVELIRAKTGVSYDDAKVALEASNDDVLDAIIWLERLGKATAESATYTTTATVEPGPVSPEMAQAQTAYQESAKKSKFGEYMTKVFAEIKRLCKKGIDVSFVVERHGERLIALPALVLVIGILLWALAIPLLIIGLFLDCHYHFEGVGTVTVNVNEVMDKASEVADSIKKDVTKED